MPDCPNDMAASTTSCSNTVSTHEPVPSSPPPSYEHVLAETRQQAAAAAAAAAAEAETQSHEEQTPVEEQKVVVDLPYEDTDNNESEFQDENEDHDERESDECSENEEASPAQPSPKRPEILHKSSKELYRAVAAQWGITCKMSDHCRCLDCQSRYFDCEYDQNEQEKTDGGLGAGTPMFISEVMHGSACNIL